MTLGSEARFSLRSIAVVKSFDHTECQLSHLPSDHEYIPEAAKSGSSAVVALINTSIAIALPTSIDKHPQSRD